jgi:hypothetical protein
MDTMLYRVAFYRKETNICINLVFLTGFMIYPPIGFAKAPKQYLWQWLKPMLVGFVLCGMATMEPVCGQSFPNHEKNRYLSLSANYGKVEIHSKHVQNLNGANPFGISVDYGIHDFSKRAIETYGCNIRMGGTVQLWQFDHEVLGQGAAALAYVEPFLLTYDRFMLSLKASAGLIALNKPYNQQSNPENQAYSTHVAFPLVIGMSMYLPLNYKWAVVCNGSFNHFSNGGIKKPNYGLNYPALSLGIEHNFNHYGVPPRKSYQNLKLPLTANRQRIETHVSVALMENDNADKTKFVLVHGKYNRQLTRINGLGAGFLAEADIYGFDEYAASALLGHRFYLGKFGFTQDLGIYLWDTNPDHPAFNQFYSFDFSITQQLMVGANLKAHGKTAQYMGIRLGLLW